MNKRDYFLYSIKKNYVLKRLWVLVVFTIQPDTLSHDITEEIGLEIKNKIMYITIEGKKEIIEDFVPDKPLYSRNEFVILKAGELKSLKQDIVSTYGILVLNTLLIETIYEGLVPYINSEMDSKILNKMAKQALSLDKVSCQMHLKFENAVSFITILAPAGVPSATEKSVALNPLIKPLKEKLLAEYKDQLHDPAIITMIQKQLQQIDDEYLKDDPSGRFIITDKAKNSRLKIQGLLGSEADFIDETKYSLITKSLDEGWSAQELPVIINSLRGGSFNRGANTALGGYENKIVGRVFQNYKITDDDCFTTLGLPYKINEDNYNFLVGRYRVGEANALTNSHLNSLIGKTIFLRDPNFCSLPGTTFCKKCFGDVVSNSSVGLTAKMTTITSEFLSIFLALFHQTALKVERYNYKNRIS